MTQLNTPYPATAYLTGCLRRHAGADVEVAQADFSIELFLRLFSRAGMQEVRDALAARMPGPRRRAERAAVPASVVHFLEHADTYASLVEPVLAFLQGRDPGLALRIVGRAFLPEGPRFAAIDRPGGRPALGWAFGELGTTDRARHLASLFVDDLADVMRDGIDPRFELSRYGEKLAASAATFDALAEALEEEPTLVDEALDQLTRQWVRDRTPDLVGLTVPFPGNLYGALRIARVVKAERPAARVALGGGYVNTELRQLNDPRVFDACDFITLDDGERPLLALIDHLRDSSAAAAPDLPAAGGAGRPRHDARLTDLHHHDTGTPTYDGLPLTRYVSLFEMLNPMHRLWSDGRWNKLTIARGCYWKKCTFCDVSLDYISRYEAASAEVTVDRIESLVRETGADGVSLRGRGRPARGPAGHGPGARRSQARHHLVGQHPLREELHPGAGRPAGPVGLRRGQRRAGGGLRPPAHPDEEGGDRGPGGAGGARLQRRRRPGARLPDVRLPHRDRAGDGRFAGARAPAVRRGLHPVGLLAPLRRHRPQPDRQAPASCSASAWRPKPRPRPLPATSCRSTIPPAATTGGWAPACARPYTITCTAWGSKRTSAAGSTLRRRQAKTGSAPPPGDAAARPPCPRPRCRRISSAARWPRAD